MLKYIYWRNVVISLQLSQSNPHLQEFERGTIIFDFLPVHRLVDLFANTI